jgi:hypothetical protein
MRLLLAHGAAIQRCMVVMVKAAEEDRGSRRRKRRRWRWRWLEVVVVGSDTFVRSALVCGCVWT